MQLTADPEDWVWIRWEFARPEARPMPFFHAFQFELWDDTRRNVYTGPQIAMLPSKYRPSRYSPLKGDHFLGIPEYWQTGLPHGARPTGDILPGCQGELWQSVLQLGISVASTFIDGPVQVADGGSVEGGTARQTSGDVVYAAGGQVEGGTANQHAGYVVHAAGGQKEGGTAGIHGGYKTFAAGGQAEGGTATQYGIIIMTATTSLPVGCIVPMASLTLTDALACDGSAVSRTTYAALFAVIGTTWGTGDGSTTFNLPDFRDRVIIGTSPGSLSGNRPTARTLAATGGEEAHSLSIPELPSFTPSMSSGFAPISVGGGGTLAFGSDQSYESDGFDSIGGDAAHNTMQPFAVVVWGIIYQTNDTSGGSGARTGGNVAAGGTTQTDATPITVDTATITGANGSNGTKLVDGAAKIVVAYNSDPTHTTSVYPHSGAQIGSLGTNNPQTLMPGGSAMFCRVSSTQWSLATLI